MTFFYQNLLKPYQDMFAAQTGDALAQAKESAGNLTGSGYNNILGSSLASSLAGQQQLTAQTLMGLRQQEIQRQQNFLNSLLGFASTGVGPDQTAYQPGLLDSLLPVAGQIGGQWLAGRVGQPAPTQYTGNPFGGPGTTFNAPFSSPSAVYPGAQQQGFLPGTQLPIGFGQWRP